MAKNINFGTLGETPLMEAWKDFVDTASALSGQQAMIWAGALQRIMLSNYSSGDWMEAVNQLYASNLQTAYTLAAFPYLWCRRFMGDVPSMVFIIDQASQSTDPQTVFTPVSLPAEYEASSTDLTMVGGTHKVLSAEAHVHAKLLEDGNRVSVQLVNLMKMDSASGPHGGLKNGIHHGLYMGLVYGEAEGDYARRPLVILYVQVLGA